jgi:predicted metal-dependent peptidase
MSTVATVVTPELNMLLNKAKVALMETRDATFFTTICFSLKFVWDDTQPTAYTDGMVLGFNPNFFKSLPMDERIGVMIHEAMHVAYDHMGRLFTTAGPAPSAEEAEDHNKAADHVINLQLLDRGFKLPSIRLADERFRNMSTEEVYAVIRGERKINPNPPPLAMPDIRVGSPADQHGISEKVQDILMRAAIQSKMRGDAPGSIPGDIELYLDSLLNPKLPWQTILRKYLKEMDKSDYSFRKPNRRFMPEYYLPSLYGDSLMDLVIAVDISGSVSDADFKRFVSEIAGIFKMMKPKKITLIQFDTRIQHTDEIHNLVELSKIKFNGRGGTNIEPVMDWAEKHKPQMLMFFTDGGFRFYRQATKIKTLWLIHDNPKWTAAFGKVIHYKMKE